MELTDSSDMTELNLYARNTADWTLSHSAIVKLQGHGQTYTVKCPFYVVEHPEGVVLFDTGVSYEMQQDPSSYGQHGAPHMEPFMEALQMSEDQRPEALLADIGYEPDDIDKVVLSHLHVDHAGNIETFPNAEFLVQQDELKYAWWPTDPIQQSFYLEGDFGVLRSHDYNVTPLNGAYDVFGDGRVVCLPTPGHTPGHQSVVLDSVEGQTVILAADVAHVRDAYEKELCTAFNWSTEETVASIRRVRDLAREEDALVAFLHDSDDFETLSDQPGITTRDPSTD